MELILHVLGVLTALAGALMLGFGIPNNAFGTGNTLIGAGTTAVVGGFLLIGLALVVRQLRGVIEAIEIRSPARDLGAIPASPAPLSARLRARAQAAMATAPHTSPAEPVEREPGSPYRAAEPRAGVAAQPAAPTVARGLAASERFEAPVAIAERSVSRPRDEAPGEYPDEEPMRPHPDEERMALETYAPSLPDDVPGEPERRGEFDSVWPAGASPAQGPTDWRGRAIETRGGGPYPAPADDHEHFAADAEQAVAHRPARDPQGESILQSGVIDGLAYTLYVDGSIEAELPQGTLRFGSIDELRDYLAGKE